MIKLYAYSIILPFPKLSRKRVEQQGLKKKEVNKVRFDLFIPKDY